MRSWKCSTHTVYMKIPITTDGTPVMTSVRKRMNRGQPALLAVLVEVDRAEDPDGDGDERRQPVMSSVPTMAGCMP